MPMQLEIVSPERRAYSDEVDMVTVPGIDGELGILPHHTRLISALGIGELRIKKAGTEQILLISGGFVEVRPDKVVVMADLAEHSDEIDERKAVEARKRAEAELERATTRRTSPASVRRSRRPSCASGSPCDEGREASGRTRRSDESPRSSRNSDTSKTPRPIRTIHGMSRRRGSLNRRGSASCVRRPRLTRVHPPAATTLCTHSDSGP